jgi:hypothetical protein
VIIFFSRLLTIQISNINRSDIVKITTAILNMTALLHTRLLCLLTNLLIYPVAAFVPYHKRQLSFATTSIPSYGRMFASTNNGDEKREELVTSKPHVPNVILVECGKHKIIVFNSFSDVIKWPFFDYPSFNQFPYTHITC